MMEFQIRVDIKKGRYKVSTTIKKYKDEISKGIFRVPTATEDRVSSGNKYTKEMAKSLHKFIIKKDKKWWYIGWGSYLEYTLIVLAFFKIINKFTC